MSVHRASIGLSDFLPTHHSQSPGLCCYITSVNKTMDFGKIKDVIRNCSRPFLNFVKLKCFTDTLETAISWTSFTESAKITIPQTPCLARYTWCCTEHRILTENAELIILRNLCLLGKPWQLATGKFELS